MGRRLHQVDAEWLASNMLKGGPLAARRRLDSLCSRGAGWRRTVASSPTGAGPPFSRLFPLAALMLALEATACEMRRHPAAVRVAAGLAGDDEATACSRPGSTIVDRARLAGTSRGSLGRSCSLVGGPSTPGTCQPARLDEGGFADRPAACLGVPHSRGTPTRRRWCWGRWTDRAGAAHRRMGRRAVRWIWLSRSWVA